MIELVTTVCVLQQIDRFDGGPIVYQLSDPYDIVVCG